MYKDINVSGRHWVAFSLVILQWFFMTQTTPFSFRGYAWYYNLAISVFAFLIMKRKVVWALLGKYRLIFLIMGCGWLLMLLTQKDLELNTMWGIKNIIRLTSFLLLIPIMSNPVFRKFLFFAIIYTALVKSITVYDYAQGELYAGDALSGFGKDKNYVGLLFGMSLSMIFPIIIVPNIAGIYRVLSSGFSVWILYSLFTTGSRTASITAILSILIISLFIIRSLGSLKVLMSTVLIITFILFISSWAIQALMNEYGLLFLNFMKLVDFIQGNSYDINGRILLLNSGFDMVIEKPFLGHGYESSRWVLGEAILTHNTYLSEWIEIGLAGIMPLVLFNVFVVKEMKSQLLNYNKSKKSIFDLGLGFIGLPLAIMLFFLNMSTFFYFVLCLYTAIEYEKIHLHKMERNYGFLNG